MNKLDLIFMALKNLAKRKVRTSLTIISVIIGATAIIVMVSLGIALDVKFDKEIEGLSSITEIELSAFNSKITRQDIENIKTFENVKAITPILQGAINLSVANKYVGVFDVLAMEPQTMEAFGYKLANGRLLNEEDFNKNALVFGGKAIYAFSKKGKADPWYNYIDNPEDEKGLINIDVLNSSIKINTDINFGVKKQKSASPVELAPVANKAYPATAVGILEIKDQYTSDHNIFMPIERYEFIKKQMEKSTTGNTGQNNVQNKKGYETVKIKVNNFKNVENLAEEIKQYFAKDNRDINVQTFSDYIQSSKRLTKTIQALLGGIGGISLLIAAIGIANTMVMSIYERTKEIGIMKVIGAKVSDIKNLFLLEATFIGGIGGLLGVLFSYFISFGLNYFIAKYLAEFSLSADVQKISIIPVWLAIGALLFSALIGLLAGYLPAKKVVKIEALKAIKSE